MEEQGRVVVVHFAAMLKKEKVILSYDFE